MIKINAVYIRTFLIFLVILTVFLFLILYISNKHKTDIVGILVASQNIPSGVFIKSEMVIKTKFPGYLTNSNEIKDLEEVAELTTITAIPKDDPIVYNQFSPTEKAQAPIQSHN